MTDIGGSATDVTNSNENSVDSALSSASATDEDALGLASTSSAAAVGGTRDDVLFEPSSVSEIEEEGAMNDESADNEIMDQDLKPPLLAPEEPTTGDDGGGGGGGGSPRPEEVEVAAEDAASAVDEDHHEQGNTIMISAEDIAEAGLDMDNLDELSEEQVNTLMTIAERRTQREMVAAADSQGGHEIQATDDYSDGAVAVSSDAITMVITDDGSLKLTDASNQTFFFDTEQLSQMNVDVNNLTDESIQQIIHMAMPVINVGKGPTAEHEQQKTAEESALFDHTDTLDMMQPGGSSSGGPMKQEVLRASQLIGEQVEIRREGKPMVATIRYVRNGGSYKVQFEDGHFEWITDEQITLRGNRRPDHESYHMDTGSAGSAAGAASQPSQQQQQALPRAIHSNVLPAALKRAAAGALMRANAAKRQHLQEPNFCCPICENKVHQKEPAYIVIRIPACDACTREKIIVLDDQQEEDDRQPSSAVQ